MIESKNLGTIEYNTGLQVSGVFKRVITDHHLNPIYIQTEGPTALSYHEKELIGHGTYTHTQGFGSPIGRLKHINMAIEDMSPYDLEAYNIKEGQMTRLAFEGGITVEGEVITGTRNRTGKVLLVSFKNCTVKHHDEVLFHPDWGIYDMAIGKTIVSAYAGPADYTSFDMITHELETKEKNTVVSSEVQRLRELYAIVRKERQQNSINEKKCIEIFEEWQSKYPDEWLLGVELYELSYNQQYSIQEEIKSLLMTLMERSQEVAHLIEDGMELIENPIAFKSLVS